MSSVIFLDCALAEIPCLKIYDVPVDFNCTIALHAVDTHNAHVTRGHFCEATRVVKRAEGGNGLVHVVALLLKQINGKVSDPAKILRKKIRYMQKGEPESPPLKQPKMKPGLAFPTPI